MKIAQALKEIHGLEDSEIYKLVYENYTVDGYYEVEDDNEDEPNEALQSAYKSYVEDKQKIRIKTTSARLFYKGQWNNCEIDDGSSPWDYFTCQFK
jgi:hypothetical protein